ncbi:YozQ family protein [Marinicrinis lubricantis]|uniref:YozQ family protein n=1 Tax=Marinicrinis lubricantis TaxID=2086470 RepID=A0ABW1IJT4_9BACL
MTPNQNGNEKQEPLGRKMYEVSDYEKNTRMSKGLAETHEQVSDTFTSGNNDDTFIRDGVDLVQKDQQ